MIKIEKEPLIVDQDETVEFQEISIIKEKGLVRAKITFGVLNAAGDVLRNEYLIYNGKEYNKFWEDFVSGKYLYEQLKKQLQLDVDILDKVEDDFINSVDSKDILEEPMLETTK